MRKLLITGGTGFIGQHLAKYAQENGCEVTILTRDTTKNSPYKLAHWDVDKGEVDTAAVVSSDVVFHLAGANIMGKRWTKAYKKEIYDSRINATRLLVDCLKNNQHKVQQLVASTAIGWYGEDGASLVGFKENDSPAKDYLASVCKDWEAEILKAKDAGLNVAMLRQGIVLGSDGGAYDKLKKEINKGIAPIFWPGRQMVSWVHIDDLVRMFLFAADENLNGAFNAAADVPETNKTYTMKIAKHIRDGFFLPVYLPRFLMNLIIGEASIELFKSCTVSNQKIKSEGYVFQFPTLDAALKQL